MSAIQSHHTETVDKPWDGAGNVARLANDGGRAMYRKMFAWVDPDADQDAKSAYKFPHHEVDGDGNPGPANVRGCIAAIAALNGGRGGAKIPDEDRKGVWNHLATHLRDAEMEPPELKSRDGESQIERRVWEGGELEVRAADDGENKLVGYAAVFNRRSEPIMGLFYEVVEPGAFDDVLDDDVRALWNHDPNYVLGRTTAGTLKLFVDDIGLRVEINPPDTQFARDAMKSVARGDVTQMSFGFSVKEDRWVEPENDGELPTRYVTRFAQLYDVSPVTFPAYPQTTITVRSTAEALRAQREADHHTVSDDRAAAGAVDVLRRRLELLDLEVTGNGP